MTRMPVVLFAWLALAGAAAATPPTAVPVPLPPMPPAAVEELPPDPQAGVLRRREALERLAPSLKVTRAPTTPKECPRQIQAALSRGAYQVFIERKNLVPILAPLAYDFVLREAIDPERIDLACQVAKGLVIARLSDDVRRTQDPKVRDDYVQVLFLAHWAQAKADGKGMSPDKIPPDVTPDPFGVLTKAGIVGPQAAPALPESR